jgi:D-alanyl-D-alanine carboxypeptidase/D-alanyl-D-alanine-endopeptidase (penicillin-binding protein 4)
VSDGPGVRSAGAGRLAAQAILEGWGVPASELILRDGSGLSRYDFVSPAALVAILAHVDRDARLREPFLASLPIAGRDGTLSTRMLGTPAEGNVAREDWVDDRRARHRGYVATADGERLVFSIVANNFETPADVVNAARTRSLSPSRGSAGRVPRLAARRPAQLSMAPPSAAEPHGCRTDGPLPYSAVALPKSCHRIPDVGVMDEVTVEPRP